MKQCKYRGGEKEDVIIINVALWRENLIGTYSEVSFFCGDIAWRNLFSSPEVYPRLYFREPSTGCGHSDSPVHHAFFPDTILDPELGIIYIQVTPKADK
jgi:hypothetical protein